MKNNTKSRHGIIALLLLLSVSSMFSQTNSFPTTGNVNIGGPTPGSGKLQVDGDINSTGPSPRKIGFITYDPANSEFANYGMSYSNTFPTGVPSVNGPGVMLSGYHGLSFYTNALERIRISRLGNVGIGTTEPESKLQVADGDINSTGWGNSLAPRRIGFYTNDHTDATNGIANYGLTYLDKFPIGGTTNHHVVTMSGFFGMSFYTTGSERIRITEEGNIGIGKTNPGSMLDVNGEITALAIKGPSDIRYKKNIKPLRNSLEKVMALRGYTYEWKKDEFKDKNFKSGTDMGLIAQEVEKIFPEVVYTDNDEMKSKSIDYSKLVPVLIESIKELQNEVEALKKQLNQKK